ncbi:MAG: DUF1566 domain-containing protein [Saprospiraceae bacterium]|nr:DUF1566 domain-containing protein [Saprospiraceae bacterium]
MLHLLLEHSFVLLINLINAQAPNLITYQAVIRKSDNSLVQNQKVGVKLSILSNSSNGSIVYLENHSPTTNFNGLLTLQIGNGTNKTFSIDNINWSNGNYFINIEVDPTGGTNYTLNINSQLLSVPYSLYANKANKLHNHYIGELFQGGIIFHLYNDTDGSEHGLIVSLSELNATPWSNITDSKSQVGINFWNGPKNTEAIINQAGHNESAAQSCRVLRDGGFSDWYLPSLDELNLLHLARYQVNKVADSDNLIETNPINYGDYYWTSTESLPNTAFLVHFATGDNHTVGKNKIYPYRAIRKF